MDPFQSHLQQRLPNLPHFIMLPSNLVTIVDITKTFLLYILILLLEYQPIPHFSVTYYFFLGSDHCYCFSQLINQINQLYPIEKPPPLLRKMYFEK